MASSCALTFVRNGKVCCATNDPEHLCDECKKEQQRSRPVPVPTRPVPVRSNAKQWSEKKLKELNNRLARTKELTMNTMSLEPTSSFNLLEATIMPSTSQRNLAYRARRKRELIRNARRLQSETMQSLAQADPYEWAALERDLRVLNRRPEHDDEDDEEDDMDDMEPDEDEDDMLRTHNSVPFNSRNGERWLNRNEPADGGLGIPTLNWGEEAYGTRAQGRGYSDSASDLSYGRQSGDGPYNYPASDDYYGGNPLFGTRSGYGTSGYQQRGNGARGDPRASGSFSGYDQRSAYGGSGYVPSDRGASADATSRYDDPDWAGRTRRARDQGANLPLADEDEDEDNYRERQRRLGLHTGGAEDLLELPRTVGEIVDEIHAARSRQGGKALTRTDTF
jgi:hypothetical protein